MQCDYRFEHDPATDRPKGSRCTNPATHRIEWDDDRRYSLACDDHLEIEPQATVKPSAIRKLCAQSSPHACLPGRCQKCDTQACLNCRARIESEMKWEKTTYVLGDCSTCAPGAE